MPHRHSARACHHAAYLALLAMLLLVAGPAIGQFSAFGKAEHGHHAGPAFSAESADSESLLPEAMSWHEQCGYCVLFHHCPVLATALPQTARAPLPATTEPIAATCPAQGNFTRFLHALTRAPPIASL